MNIGSVKVNKLVLSVACWEYQAFRIEKTLAKFCVSIIKLSDLPELLVTA